MAAAAPLAITPEDIELIKDAFGENDKGGGGKITRAALGKIFRTLEGDAAWSDEDLSDLFDLVGANSDGYIKYDKFVNYIMQDEEESDDDGDHLHRAHAEAMECKSVMPERAVDLSQLLSRATFVALARKLDHDEEEANDIFDQVEAELAAKGHTDSDGELPLKEFLDDLHVQEEDKEAVQHVATLLEEVKARMAAGDMEDESEHHDERKAIDIGIDKICRMLNEERRPPEDVPAILQEGRCTLSKATLHLIDELSGGTAALVERVKAFQASPPMLAPSAGQQGNFEACSAKVAKIVADCKASGTKFTDTEWDMTKGLEEVLYVDKERPGYDCTVGKPAGYKRLPEMIKGTPMLTKGGVKAGDIIQGQIGTCFLLGAMGAIVSNNENVIHKLFIKYDIDTGVYGVRFNVDGDWVHVIIDDYMPVNQYGGLLYSNCMDKQEMWVPLLEKAYCKLHTCYEMCDGGKAAEAIFSFFGGTNGRFLIDDRYKQNPVAYFQVLKSARDLGWLLTGSFSPPKAGSMAAHGKCGEAVNVSGLVGGHVYSVLKVQEACGLYLVQLRNPWGTGEWLGKYADKNTDGEWTPELIAATGYEFKDDGKFWMCIEDLVAYSNGIDFARDFGPPWKKLTHYRRFQQGDLLAVAQWPYKAGGEDEISFAKGEEIEIAEIHKGWWSGCTLANRSKYGLFPGNYVRLKDQPVACFELAGAATVTAVVILMQPNSRMKRKFFKRKADGLNFKDVAYARMQLTIVGADGKLLDKKEGTRRELSGEVTLAAGPVRLYCMSTDGLGTEFSLRVYVKDGEVTLKEVEGESIDDLAVFLNQ